jgi:hypothetical protein
MMGNFVKISENQITRAKTISIIFISSGFLVRIKPPFAPGILSINPAFFNCSIICSRYFSDIFCLLAISSTFTGSPIELSPH